MTWHGCVRVRLCVGLSDSASPFAGMDTIGHFSVPKRYSVRHEAEEPEAEEKSEEKNTLFMVSLKSPKSASSSGKRMTQMAMQAG